MAVSVAKIAIFVLIAVYRFVNVFVILNTKRTILVNSKKVTPEIWPMFCIGVLRASMRFRSNEIALI